MNVWLRFVLAVLATWRITHLLTSEDGPADVLYRLRARLGSSLAGKLMDCFFCLSLWVAAPMALFVSRQLAEWALTWVAISGAACLVERLVPEPQPPVVIRQLAEEEGGLPHAVLRPETREPEDRPFSAGDR